MYIRRLLYFKYSEIIISILLGFGLATLFRKNCQNRQCLVFKGPGSDEIKETVYKFGNKCYSFHPQYSKCHSHKKIVEFV